jgi:hypothetical protein
MENYLPRDRGVLNVVPLRGNSNFREIGVIHHFVQAQQPPTPDSLNNLIVQATGALDNLIHSPNAMMMSGRDYHNLRGNRLIPLVILVETQTVVHKMMPAPIEVGTKGNKWDDDDEPPTKKDKSLKSNTNTLTLLL